MGILKSINYWSFPGGLDGAADIRYVLEKAKGYGYDAVELCIGLSGQLTPETTQAECAAILKMASEIGIKVGSVASGIYWAYNLASEAEADRAKAVDTLKKMVRVTSWLGCKTLLTIPGAVDIFFDPAAPVIPYETVRERAIAGLSEVLPEAADCRVTMAIENVWNKFLLSPYEMKTFIDQFNSPYIGAYVDVANLLPFGHAEDWLRVLGKRVAGIHFKDFKRSVGTLDGFVDLLEGDVNWPGVMTAIREIGYDGPVVAEMIPYYKHCPEVRVANTSRAMDAILEL